MPDDKIPQKCMVPKTTLHTLKVHPEEGGVQREGGRSEQLHNKGYMTPCIDLKIRGSIPDNSMGDGRH